MNAYRFSGLLLGATAVLATGCSQQEDSPRFGEEQTVTFRTHLPGGMTRSAGDGTKANTLKCFIYNSAGEFVDSQEGSMANASGEVTMRLASGEDYTLVFWSDTKLADSPYSITDEGMLTVDYSKMSANDDSTDAFYLSTTYHAGDSNNESVVLKRPFAQVNFGTDDLNLEVVKKGYKDNVVTTVTMEAYTQMDLRDGTASNPIELTTNAARAKDLSGERFPTGQGETADKDQYGYLNMGYVLVPTEGTTSNLTLKSYNTDPMAADPIWTLNVPNAPLKQNYRTNVFGALLTTQTDFEVTIDPIFDGYAVASVAEFKKAAEKGGTIILGKALDMEGETIVVEAGKSLDVDLNGNSIKNTAFIVNGTLNVSGTGAISAPTTAIDEPIIKVVEGGNLTLTDGTFEKGVTRSTRSEVKPCVEVTGGTATISGGVYRNEANGVAYAPVKANGGKLVINGGSFYKADPHNFTEFGASESVLTSTAEVYTKGDYFNVLDITRVSTAEELLAAASLVKENNFEITVTKDIVIRDGVSTSGSYKGGLIFNSPNTVLNINPGVTLTLGADAKGTTASESINYGIICPAGKNLTINNQGLIRGNTRLMKPFGNITLNGGKFEAYNLTKGSMLFVEDGGSAVLNNVHFVAEYCCVSNRGETTINGGYFEGRSTNRRKVWIYAVKNDMDAYDARMIINNAEVVGVQGCVGAADGYTEINGGYYHTHRSQPGALDNFYAVSMVESYASTVVINGGLFSSESHEANHGACINWIPWSYPGFVDPWSTLEIKGGKFSSKGFYGYMSEWEAKPFVDNYLTPAAGYKWKAINEDPYNWQVVKDSSAPAQTPKKKVAKPSKLQAMKYRRLNSGSAR